MATAVTNRRTATPQRSERAARAVAPLPGTPLPPEALPALYQFSVKQYMQMAGVFAEEKRLELINGWVVHKMTRYPPHDGTLSWLLDFFGQVLPAEWVLRCQMAFALAHSVPEPDLAIVRGPKEDYFKRHPGPRDTALVIEVSEASLEYDRTVKGILYAEARLAEYWVVNVVALQVEVYTRPRAGKVPGFRQRKDYVRGATVPVLLDGREIAALKVASLFAGLAAE